MSSGSSGGQLDEEEGIRDEGDDEDEENIEEPKESDPGGLGWLVERQSILARPIVILIHELTYYTL
jgi:hypothetical protein